MTNLVGKATADNCTPCRMRHDAQIAGLQAEIERLQSSDAIEAMRWRPQTEPLPETGEIEMCFYDEDFGWAVGVRSVDYRPLDPGDWWRPWTPPKGC